VPRDELALVGNSGAVAPEEVQELAREVRAALQVDGAGGIVGCPTRLAPTLDRGAQPWIFGRGGEAPKPVVVEDAGGVAANIVFSGKLRRSGPPISSSRGRRIGSGPKPCANIV